jgi:DNA-binding NarL/FixJ family response regulator
MNLADHMAADVTTDVAAHCLNLGTKGPCEKARKMKILLVDDHQLFREGVALLLQRLSSDLDLLQAGSCEDALALCEAHGDTDLILLDLNLAGMGGMDGLAKMRERYPGIPVVMVSSSDGSLTVRKAIDAGAMGFIPKSSSSEIMLNALRLVLAKGIYLPSSVLLSESAPASLKSRSMSPASTAWRSGTAPITPLDLGLTPRQSEVLYLVLQGKPIKLICRELNLGEATVKGQVSGVLRALNVTTRTQAIVAAHRLGLVFEPSPSATRINPTVNRP